MAQFTVVLVLIALSYCSAENVYCVTPTATSCSSCPQNSTQCTTLSEYAQEAELYFTSNTTMVFLPGDHVLNINIEVANVDRLIMHGESSSGNKPIVVCNGPVGLHFTRLVNFRVYSLAFTSCGRYYSSQSTNRYAVLLDLMEYVELVNCSFHYNLGTALVVNNSNSITLAGNTEFTHNHCNQCFGGGSITALSSNLTLSGNTTFLANSAFIYGAAGIYMVNCNLSSSGTIHYMSNTNSYSISQENEPSCAARSSLNFTETNNFTDKSKVLACGGAISATNSSLSFTTSSFSDNSAMMGGAICTSDSVLTFTETSTFSRNMAGYMGGAIIAFGTMLMFKGNIRFTNNYSLLWGGAVFLINSTCSILPNTTVHWENNRATLGGSIFITDNPFIYCTHLKAKEECFFQLPGLNLSNGIDVQLVFKNNSADAAGSVLYGGAIDNCKLTGLDLYDSGKVFDMITHMEDDNTTSSITSDPFRICLCENSHPDSSKSDITHAVYPGETFRVSVVAVGQRNGTVAAAVRSRTLSNAVYNIQMESGELRRFQYLQQTNNTCTTLNYTVFSLSSLVTLVLYADGPCSTFSDKLEFNLNMYWKCPPGFRLSQSASSCVCEQRLEKYTNQCYITNGLGRITHGSNQYFWVGYDNQSHGLILHPHCPFDYCVSQTVVFPLNNTDLQCAYNRSGLLCGHCKEGYSLVLGTSHCKQCNNSHLALIISFAVMGVALVVLLLVLKLTVATGTLSGLVFYANILGVNRTIFLPVEYTDAFTVFIAWLNLDFGIETCFFDGMDAYSKAWLQFVFPVYLWMLVGIVIFLSYFSHSFAKLLGNNPVSVLATLIFLSYTKILRTLISAIYITYLEYPKYNRGVWLYDASVDYLVGKHIPLFLVAVLVFLFLFLPYTLLLLFGQWLQAISHLRLFSWVNNARLKPFVNSYHAPYKAKYRYWPGLLLMLRFVLLLIFAFNPQQELSINLLAILVGTGMLVVWAWVSGGVYKNWCLDALEGSFALNLIVLSAATYHIKLAGGNQPSQLAAWYTSVSVAFTTFLGILAFMLVNATGITRSLKRKCTGLRLMRRVHQVEEEEEYDIDTLPDRLINPLKYESPLSTVREQNIDDSPENKELVDGAQRRMTPVYTYGSIN